MSLEIIFRKKRTGITLFCLSFFLSTCYMVSLMRGHIIVISVRRRCNRTYFEDQCMALRLRKRFLAELNCFFVCCLFVVLFVTA